MKRERRCSPREGRQRQTGRQGARAEGKRGFQGGVVSRDESTAGGVTATIVAHI